MSNRTTFSLLPPTPPFALISSTASLMESRTVTSEMAIVPESEWRMPTLMVSCAAAGITLRDFTDAEITDRYLTAMISEAARVIGEGIARRPVDIDAVFLFGYGFPRHLGGPMFHADTIGAPELVRRIEDYAKDDPQFWTVPLLLARIAKDGTSFAAMTEAG